MTKSLLNWGAIGDMPLLLRNVGKHYRWIKADAAPYLAQGDVPADPVGDLKTSGNKLSVYVIADDRSNLHRVIRAITVGSLKPDHVAYVVFSSKVLEDAGIEMEEVVGKTADDAVNPLHRDLILSGNKLIALTRGILQEGEVGQILKADLLALVEQGINEGQLPEKLREWLRKK
ncbi:MAG: hypothetical protein JWO19_108 [Bryobacterales bacterium]|nr:hypothetical protein [Bryobacterales bacterium]